MSRIGKLPIILPSNVFLTVSDGNVVKVKGPLGELHQQVAPQISVTDSENKIVLTRTSEDKLAKAMHGLYRALINNMVHGVSVGYETKLELVGVGYRVELYPAMPNVLDFALGYSHHIFLQLPNEIKVEVQGDRRSNPILSLKCIDKQLLGQVAAKIRSFRKPEPYKGKGIKFVNETLRRKAGKSAGAKKK